MKIVRNTLLHLSLLLIVVSSSASAKEMSGFTPVWQSRLTENLFHFKPFEYSSCTVEEAYSRIFITNRVGEILILNSTSGEILSRYTMKDPIHRSPLLSDNSLFAGSTGGEIIALDVSRKHPQLLWRKELNGGIVSDIADDRDRLLLLTDRNTLYAISKKDGEIIFKVDSELKEGYSIYTTTPIISIAGRIIYTTSAGELFQIDGETGRIIDKQSIFNTEEKVDGFTGLAISDNSIFLSTLSGLLCKIDTTSGNIIWTRELKGITKMNIENSSGHILTLLSDGEIYIYDKEGSLLNRRIWLKKKTQGFNLTKKRILLRYTDGTVLLLSTSNLSFISSIKFRSPILSEITIQENQAYIFSSRGILYRFQIQ